MSLTKLSAFGLAIGAMAAWAAAWAEPPPAIEAQLLQIGRVVDAPGTMAIYGPLLAKQSYAGVVFTRDIAYGPDPRNILDVAAPQDKSQGLRPVLIFVSGGAGDKLQAGASGAPFYDNIMLVAARNGMVGVNVERRAGAGLAWDAGGHDVADAVRWARQNIRQFGGDPGRIVIWGHSAAAASLALYLSHQALWGPDGVGVKAAVLMSGGYNLAPLGAPSTPPPAGFVGPVDPAVRLQRTTLPGFQALTIPLYVTVAELDSDQVLGAAHLLNDVMCQAGHCPRFQFNKGQSHVSEVTSINTDDTGVSAPLFAWIKTVD